MVTSTHTLDHLIYLAPPGKLHDVITHFTSQGFTVLPGGTHADGLTANALVVLPSGVYFELIHFVKTPEETGPPGSPERVARENHWWADKQPGWIDWALLGIPGPKAAEEHYQEPRRGGRRREDGEELKWSVTFPQSVHKRGALPFYCQDITPRDRRVPANNLEHKNGTHRVARVILHIPEGSLDRLVDIYSTILGHRPDEHTHPEASFVLSDPHGSLKTRLLLVTNTGTEHPILHSVFTEDVDGHEHPVNLF